MDVFAIPGRDLRCMQGIKLEAADTGNALMGKLGIGFRRWRRCEKKIDIPPFTWNMHLLGRAEGDGRGYPELDSNVKAIHTKTLLFFLAELAAELFQFCNCSLDDYLNHCFEH